MAITLLVVGVGCLLPTTAADKPTHQPGSLLELGNESDWVPIGVTADPSRQITSAQRPVAATPVAPEEVTTPPAIKPPPARPPAPRDETAPRAADPIAPPAPTNPPDTTAAPTPRAATADDTMPPPVDTSHPDAGETVRRPAQFDTLVTQTADGERTVRSGSSWRTFVALAAVVALIVLLWWGYRAVNGNGLNFRLLSRARRAHLIEVVARTPISPKQSLCLVRIGPRLVLVGLGPDSVTQLDVIDDAGLAAQLLGTAQQSRGDSRAQSFDRLLNDEARTYATVDEDVHQLTYAPEGEIAQARERLSGRIAALRQRLRSA